MNVHHHKDSNVHVFEDWISSALDVYKGIFIIFMLTEHTRSSFNVGMTSKEPIMQFISQVACALDMTCFSTAYGFSCYRAYLTNSKNRPMKAQLTRLFRSVGLIVACAWMCNISFELAVLRNAPSWENMWKILSFQVLYWDFLTTFPAMLLVAFLTTKPLMKIAAKFGPTSIVRWTIFAVLLAWPLLTPPLALETCPTTSSKYAAIFVGCIRRPLGAMRFSALTYMFYFNFGCIVSLLSLEFSKSGAALTSLASKLKEPHWIAFSALFAVELYYAVPLFQNYNSSWEYLNWNGYRRFPMTTPLVLGWGFMSQSIGLLALAMTAAVRPQVSSLADKIPALMRKWTSIKCAILEQFGANVLLYLTVSNFVIHGFFHVDWREFQQKDASAKGGKGRTTEKMYTIRSWEYIVVAAAIGQILFVQLLSYLVRSSRK